jgi:hypothetical protein
MNLKNLRRAMLMVLALTVLAPSGALAGDPGSAGLLSMRLGVGARYGAMGETGVASAYDGSAIYWNPANLAYAPGTQLTLQHMEYFGGLFRKESFALGHSTDYGSFGLLFSGFYSKELDRTSDEPAGVKQGTFQPYDVVIGVGYAFQFGEIALGITGKLVYERIDLYDGSTGAVDIGVTHKASVAGLTLGAALQNMGSKMVLNQQEFDLPLLLRLGAAYGLQAAKLSSGRERLMLTGEVLVPNDGNSRLHAGAELFLHELFALRGGYRFSYDTFGATFGAGFRKDAFSLDYAYMGNRDDTFDASHRFSLSLGFGQNRP